MRPTQFKKQPTLLAPILHYFYFPSALITMQRNKELTAFTVRCVASLLRYNLEHRHL